MSGSQLLAQARIVGQRQVAGGICHPIPSDNHSSVMKRCVMFKNIDQQLAGHQTVHLNTRALILLEHLFPLDHDQRPCLGSPHLRARLGDLVDGLLGERTVLPSGGI